MERDELKYGGGHYTCDKCGQVHYGSTIHYCGQNMPHIQDYKAVTGHNNPQERKAYEEGFGNQEKVMVEWIEKWDGSTNSMLGALLDRKFKELSNASKIKKD